MRKTTVLFGLLVLGLAIMQKVQAQDSDTIAKPQDAGKQAEPPAHFYRLDLVLEQVDADGKPTNSRSYTIAIDTGRSGVGTQIRTGARVPITTGASKEGEISQWQYQDVGVNIDAHGAHDVAGKLTLSLAADVSSVADTKGSEGLNYHPVLEQNKWQAEVLIPIGKATTVFSSDDIRSKGAMRLVVTATLLQ
jgi:hypothetical protein